MDKLRSVLLRGIALGVGLSLALVPLAVAQEASPDASPPGQAPITPAEPVGQPPALGVVVLEDTLAGPGVANASSCPTNRNARQFVDEGFLLRVTGRCTETSAAAGVAYLVPRLSVPDGETRLDLKFVSGVKRAQLRLWFRDQGPGRDGYSVTIEPGSGAAHLFHCTPDCPGTVLAERSDLAGTFGADSWNTLAVRTQGPSIWVLLNDQVILSAIDPTLDSGAILLALNRRSEPISVLTVASGEGGFCESRSRGRAQYPGRREGPNRYGV